MMTMTEMSGGGEGEGEGEGEESHVWYGAVTAVQKMFMYYRCRFGLLVLRIIDFQFTVFRLPLLLRRRASWIFDKSLEFS